MHRFGQQTLEEAEEATGSGFNTYLNLIERSTESVAAPSVASPLSRPALLLLVILKWASLEGSSARCMGRFVQSALH